MPSIIFSSHHLILSSSFPFNRTNNSLDFLFLGFPSKLITFYCIDCIHFHHEVLNLPPQQCALGHHCPRCTPQECRTSSSSVETCTHPTRFKQPSQRLQHQDRSYTSYHQFICYRIQRELEWNGHHFSTIRPNIQRRVGKVYCSISISAIWC